MSGIFHLKRSGTQYMFNLKSTGNGEVVLTSERYTTKQNAEAGIASVKANAPYDARYQKLWAAAGSVDTDLSFLSFLELYGTEIAERRMPARRVVEALDVVEHI